MSTVVRRIVLGAVVTTLAAALGGCGNSQSPVVRRTGGQASAGEGAACAATADCPSGQACVAVGGVGACSLVCTASGNECSGAARCGPVGAVAANFCQPPPADAGAGAEDPPRIPCRTDAECAALSEGAVCAQFRGHRDCTIPCTARAQCNPPPAGGLATDFFQCATDEGDTARTVCLPDPRCFAGDPNACVTVGGDAGYPVPDGGGYSGWDF